MKRELTDDEHAEVYAYLKENDVMHKPMSFIDDTVLYFEDKFKTPITKSLIQKSIIELMLI
jgi:hypothetical protein